MKKFIQFMAVVIGIFAAAVLVLGIIEPKDVSVTRGVLIKAPKEAVFEQMAKFHNWPNWSPWSKMDPAMKMTYYGTDGQPGGGYKWVGTEKTGAGSMTTTAVNGTRMDFDVVFTEPHDGQAKGVLKAVDTAGMTKATWTLTMHSPFPMNIGNAFVDMDRLLGGDFADGLNNIKTYVETKNPVVAVAPQQGGVEVKEVMYAAHVFQGMRQVVSWQDLDRFTLNSLVTLGRTVAAKVAGPATGLYYTWDTTKHMTDALAGFPVVDSSLPVKGAVFAVVAAGPACMVAQKGGNSQVAAAHKAITAYLGAKGKTYGLVIEEYVVGYKEEPDSNKWMTNVYYLLK